MAKDAQSNSPAQSWLGKMKASALFRTRKRAIISIAVILLLVFFGWRTFGKKSQQASYQTSTVERGTLVNSVSASGNIASGNAVNITTSATGVVNQVYVKNGDSVMAGEKIADLTLDTESQQRQIAAWVSYLSAQNSLNSTQAKINSLQSALFKANQAFVNDKGTINPIIDDPKYIEERAEWLQAEADYKNQSGIIAQAQAALNSAWLSYQQISSEITAPIDGIVTNLTITPGLPISGTSQNSSSSTSTTTTSSSSQSIGTITTEGRKLQATVNLSEIDVTKINPGQKVTLTLDAFPDKTFTGKVASINTTGTVSSGVTTYPATIVMDSGDTHIYPNMAVSAKIIIKVKDNVLLVPSTALQTQVNQTFVRVLKNGQMQQVTVTVGDASDTQTEITSGLNEGDKVVTTTINTTTTQTGGTSPFGGSGFGIFRGGGGGAGGGGNFRRN